jgi:hypothetical protein
MTRSTLSVRLVVAISAAGALVIAAGVVAAALVLRSETDNAPRRLVAAYLTAVVDGRLEDAFRLDHTVTSEHDVPLTTEAYRAARNRITRFEVLPFEHGAASGDEIRVTARTWQSSGSATATFTLQRDHGGALRLLPAPLGNLDVQASPLGSAPEVNGMRVQPGLSTMLYAFPGTYTLSAPDTPEFRTADSEAVLTGFGTRAALAPRVTLTDAGRASIESAARAYLERCLALGDAAERPECPFALGPGEKWWNSGRWELSAEPTYTVGEWREKCWSAAGCWSIESTHVELRFTGSDADGTSAGDFAPFWFTGRCFGFPDGLADFEGLPAS